VLCPKCKSSRIVRSRCQGLEKIRRYVFARTPYRCKKCWARFSKFSNPFYTVSSKLVGAFLLLIIAAVIAFTCFSPGQRSSAPTVQSLPIPKGQKAKAPIQHEITFDRLPNTETDDLQSEVSQKTDAVGSRPFVELDLHATPPQAPPATLKEAVIADPPSTSAKVAKTLPEMPTIPMQPQTPPPGFEPTATTRPLGPRSLRTLDGEDLANIFKLTIIADGPIDVYRYFTLPSPPRLAVKLTGEWNCPGKPQIPMPGNFVRRIRIGLHKDHIRLVLDLQREIVSKPIFRTIPNGLEIVIHK